jgi:hypothetical protein
LQFKWGFTARFTLRIPCDQQSEPYSSENWLIVTCHAEDSPMLLFKEPCL